MTIYLNINHISGRPPYIIITITITITTTIMFTITITITLIPEVQKAADLADISVLFSQLIVWGSNLYLCYSNRILHL